MIRDLACKVDFELKSNICKINMHHFIMKVFCKLMLPKRGITKSLADITSPTNVEKPFLNMLKLI